MSLVMSLRSRGGSGSAARAGKVLTRFGATAGAMLAGVPVTIPPAEGAIRINPKPGKLADI